MSIQLKINQQLEIKIKRLGINGEGIGYYQKLIIFVENALPEETVQIIITEATPKFARAKLFKIIKKSPERVSPPCPVYQECGGCQLQHLSYQGQLAYKKDLLRQALNKFRPEGYRNYRILPVIGMEEPWHYRNKAQFQLRKNPQKNRIEAGLYQTNSHQLVPIDDCLVQIPATQSTLNRVLQLLNKYQLPIYDESLKKQGLRTLMVRIGVETGEIQVVLISSKQLSHLNALVREISQRLPKVVSIMLNIQDKKTSVVMGTKTSLLWGKEAIGEVLNEVQYDLSANSFFQLNPSQTKILYQEAIKAFEPQKNEKVIDAYCGAGTIGLSIAKQVKEIRGMDTIPQAIEDARKNAERAGIVNTIYETGTAETLIPQWVKNGFIPDGIIVDPPRTGLDDKLLQTIIETTPTKLVYISCNVSTLAKDLTKLSKVYHIEYLQSVDMFPQTARCEVVVKMRKK